MGDRYVTFERDQWSALRAATPLDLSDGDVTRIQGINERLDLDEVADVYLPLSRLLNLHVVATHDLHTVSDTFLGHLPPQVPYILAIAGSVAVGKSTTARILQELLSRWPAHPRVELVTTDGFLFPNAELEARGLMARKGFPESYDTRRLVEFLSAVKRGEPEVEAPVYSHIRYDVTEERQIVRHPEIVIVEGLNVLQPAASAELAVSDFFDFTIYVDADEADIERWFLERFQSFRATVFNDPASFFHLYASMTDAEADAFAREVWAAINGVNLRENILPTRGRAHLVLNKGPDHRVRKVLLRRR